MKARKTVIAAALIALLPAIARAQTVRGVTVDRGNVPVPGAVVLLLDSGSAVAGRALTDGSGEFRLTTGAAGTYRVRTLRIGFRPTTSDPIALADGQTVTTRLVLSGVAFSMDTVRVAGRTACRAVADPSVSTFAIWEQVRTALTATQLTASSRVVRATTVVYDRTLDATGRHVESQSAAIRSEYVTQPWRTLAPDSLRSVGYVVTDDKGWITYYAPGLDMLLSTDFVVDHCFQIAEESNADRLGLSFEPTRDRESTPEIRGTIWLDRHTSQLRSIEFRYTNVSRNQERSRAGGAMEFVRMADGGWAVSRWNIRMPVIEQRFTGGYVGEASRAPVRELVIANIQVTGGELALATRGTDTLWSRPPLVLSGTVRDSVSDEALPGARVALVGTGLTGVADANGRFTISGVLPGEYSVQVRTASLDSIHSVDQSAVEFTGAATPIDLRVPAAAQIIKLLAATFSGSVLTDSGRAPISGVEISIPDLSLTAFTGEDGQFKLAGIPPGSHRLVVRRVGYGPMDTTVAFPARSTVNRKIFLTRVVALEQVEVLGQAIMPGFEEHRKLGLGKFITREQLATQEGRAMSDVLLQVDGVGIMQGRGGMAWIISPRKAPSLSGTQVHCPSNLEKWQGLTCECFAQVYVDRQLIYRGPEDQPFNINSISPARIEGVEFYTGPSETPTEYNNLNSACGVLVIWTRRSP